MDHLNNLLVWLGQSNSGIPNWVGITIWVGSYTCAGWFLGRIELGEPSPDDVVPYWYMSLLLKAVPWCTVACVAVIAGGMTISRGIEAGLLSTVLFVPLLIAYSAAKLFIKRYRRA